MAVYDVEDAVIPGDYQGVAAHFTSSLHRASVDKPLYLFLDAVDQLSPEDGASGMSWLPLDLPPHVKLVLSTSSEVEYRCFPVLQSLMAKHAGSLVQVYRTDYYSDVILHRAQRTIYIHILQIFCALYTEAVVNYVGLI